MLCRVGSQGGRPVCDGVFANAVIVVQGGLKDVEVKIKYGTQILYPSMRDNETFKARIRNQNAVSFLLGIILLF